MFDPITMGIGVAVSAIGMFGSNKAKKKEQKINAAIAKTNQQISRIESEASAAKEALNKEDMEMSASRSRLDILRNAQRARALAVTTGAGQGVDFGSSAIGGAFGQISGETGDQSEQLASNLRMGRSMFDINADMNARIAPLNQRLTGLGQSAAKARSSAETYSGITQLGGSIFNNSKSISGNIDTVKTGGFKSLFGG